MFYDVTEAEVVNYDDDDDDKTSYKILKQLHFEHSDKPEVSEPCITSKMKLFVKIVNGSNPWSLFGKKLYRRCLKYASGNNIFSRKAKK